jgi:hypothetical protein
MNRSTANFDDRIPPLDSPFETEPPHQIISPATNLYTKTQDQSWKNQELAPKNQPQETKIQVHIMQNPKFAHENHIPAPVSHFSYLRAKKKTHDQMCNSVNLMTKKPPPASLILIPYPQPRPKT